MISANDDVCMVGKAEFVELLYLDSDLNGFIDAQITVTKSGIVTIETASGDKITTHIANVEITWTIGGGPDGDGGEPIPEETVVPMFGHRRKSA